MKKLLPVFLILIFMVHLAPAMAQDKITISCVGDVNPQALEGKSASSLAQVKKAFAGVDIVFGNLESPLTTYSRLTPGKSPAKIQAKKDYAFKSDPATAKKLSAIGFTIFGLANNHMMDYCEQGLTDTMAILAGNNLAHCGAGYAEDARQPVIIEKKNVKVAFISYSEIVPIAADATSYSKGIVGFSYPPTETDYNNIKKSIDKARQKEADIVVVSLHWGLEGSDKIEPYQRVFARRILDAGADCIIGHHPHVIRPIETYQGKTIAYSLGNFIFPSYDRPTIVLNITFEKNSGGKWTQKCTKKGMWIKDGIPGA